jgi:hypothetical protein
VLNCVVEVDEFADRGRLDDRLRDVGAGELFDVLDGFPARQHKKFSYDVCGGAGCVSTAGAGVTPAVPRRAFLK